MDDKELMVAELVANETVITDVKIPFKSCFVLTLKFWAASLLLGIILAGIGTIMALGGGFVLALLNSGALGF